MRGPSARVLRQTASIYASGDGQDRGGGYAPSYAATATYVNVPCSAQPQGFVQTFDQGQLSVLKEWRLFFAQAVYAMPRAKITFTDDAGVSHTVYTEASRDEGGRGGCYSIKATERT